MAVVLAWGWGAVATARLCVPSVRGSGHSGYEGGPLVSMHSFTPLAVLTQGQGTGGCGTGAKCVHIHAGSGDCAGRRAGPLVTVPSFATGGCVGVGVGYWWSLYLQMLQWQWQHGGWVQCTQASSSGMAECTGRKLKARSVCTGAGKVIWVLAAYKHLQARWHEGGCSGRREWDQVVWCTVCCGWEWCWSSPPFRHDLPTQVLRCRPPGPIPPGHPRLHCKQGQPG